MMTTLKTTLVALSRHSPSVIAPDTLPGSIKPQPSISDS
jgi:hypothetical protein